MTFDLDEYLKPVLVIACGNKKKPKGEGPGRAGKWPLWEIYQGPLWTTYRAFRRENTDLPLSLWVLSAEYGIVPASTLSHPYDRQLTKRNFDEFVKKLRRQVLRGSEAQRLLRDRTVTFSGPGIYGDALDKAGLDVRRITGTGWGGMRRNLRAWLQGFADGAGDQR